MIKGTGLVVAIYDNHHFPCAEHSAYTYGQRCFGHFVYIVVKEAGVGNHGVGSQRFLTGTRRQGRARFVESDVSVGTDTTHEEVDTAVRLDFFLITCTFGIEVGSVAVQDIGIFRLDIDVAEEVVPHKGIVAFRVFLRQAYIFVHVESHYVLERYNTFFVQVD